MGPQPHRMSESDRVPPSPLPQREAHTDEQSSTARRVRILVADDEKRIRMALRACLEADGYEVYEAADGVEALDLIIGRAPDVMILDLAMPNLDGMQTLDRLEKVHGQLKPRVIVVTAWASGPVAIKAIGLGASAFLEKPLAYATLLWTIKKVLAEHPELDMERDRPPGYHASDPSPRVPGQCKSQPGEPQRRTPAPLDPPPGEEVKRHDSDAC